MENDGASGARAERFHTSAAGSRRRSATIPYEALTHHQAGAVVTTKPHYRYLLSGDVVYDPREKNSLLHHGTSKDTLSRNKSR
eukprot:5813142-Pyramimonas_sp.AAC.1